MDRVGNQHFPVADKLHTDILEEKYGPIHAVVLRHDNVETSEPGIDRIREARLVDKDDVLRTYALTFLTFDKTNTELSMIDNEIRNGVLIGQTFRKHGYVVKKNVIDVFLLDLSVKMQQDFKVASDKAKARLTEFYAKKDAAEPLIYGTVLEVYSPDFKDPNDGINNVDHAQINPSTETMQTAGIPTQEIWNRLDRAAETDEWDGLKPQYDKAKQASEATVLSLHKKIDDYLASK